MAALLRIQDDDHYVVFHTPVRPGAFGPPGGVTKYSPGARPVLDRLEFREEPRSCTSGRMQDDLRGFLPARSVPAFLRWFARGNDREGAAECLRRELSEELAETGHEELVPLVGKLSFSHVRTVFEGPDRVPGRDYRQIRRFEIWDLAPTSGPAQRLRASLISSARDGDPHVLLASGQDIVDGLCRTHYIAPQTAFLLGTRRFRSDLPALPPAR